MDPPPAYGESACRPVLSVALTGQGPAARRDTFPGPGHLDVAREISYRDPRRLHSATRGDPASTGQASIRPQPESASAGTRFLQPCRSSLDPLQSPRTPPRHPHQSGRDACRPGRPSGLDPSCQPLPPAPPAAACRQCHGRFPAAASPSSRRQPAGDQSMQRSCCRWHLLALFATQAWATPG